MKWDASMNGQKKKKLATAKTCKSLWKTMTWQH